MNKLQKFFNFFNQKVLICDLDGTLIETKSGKTFPENEDDWKFKKNIREAIQEYNPKYVFIVTNQGGIEKGFVDEGKFATKLRVVKDEIRSWGDYIVYATYCTSNDPNCKYRKPNTGMIDWLRHDYVGGNDFNPRNALMIGDASGLIGQFSDTDLQCARNAGIKYIDVADFIRAMVPCSMCDSCSLGRDIPVSRPCDFSKRFRLKANLLNK